MRLWLRGEIDRLQPLLAEMQRALVTLADAHADTVMPGFTHMQVAQPVSFAHHLLAYVEMFSRDAERLADVRRRVNRLPLGAAALAGTSYPLDRERVARTLGFDGVCENSLDAVSDRDFALEFASFASICMVHVSRLSEEIVLWMSQNFGFIDLADRYCTGSSIMPQKRNPDVAELGPRQDRPRGGPPDGPADADEGPAAHLQQGQPGRQGTAVRHRGHAARHPAHHGRDGGRITVKADAMERAALKGYATATDLADYLTKKGLPFRDAHETVAHAVKVALQRGVDLAELPLADLQAMNASIQDDVFQVLTLRGSLNARNVLGGTAPAQVRARVAAHRARLASA